MTTEALKPISIDWQSIKERYYRHGHAWGNWRLNARCEVLEFRKDGQWTYEVDLSRCLSCAQILDWLCQVSSKCCRIHVKKDPYST